MIRAVALLGGICLTAAASQVFFMDLPEVLPMSDCVILAEVLSMEEHEYDGFLEGTGSLRLLRLLHGAPAPDSCFRASYIMDLPRSQTMEDGTVMWESPLVTGSGLEFSIEPGDTVVVLLSAVELCDCTRFSVIRMEPADSLGAILDLLAVHE